MASRKLLYFRKLIKYSGLAGNAPEQVMRNRGILFWLVPFNLIERANFESLFETVNTIVTELFTQPFELTQNLDAQVLSYLCKAP